MSFYVVSVPGRETKIITNRIEALNQVIGTVGSRMSAFNNRDAAESFARLNKVSSIFPEKKVQITLPISGCTVIKIQSENKKYNATVTHDNGQQSIVNGTTPENVDSGTITYIIAIYQLMGMYTGHIKFICPDEMVVKMYKNRRRWMDASSNELIYSKLISETFRLMNERKLELLKFAPPGLH